MSEDELIEIIRNYLINMKTMIDMNCYFEINTEQAKEFYFAISTIITLKQKEIQDLKGKVEKQAKEIEKLNFENHMVKKWNEQLDKNCISKDKIREKIKKAKEIKCHTPKLVIEYFEELLEEK